MIFLWAFMLLFIPIGLPLLLVSMGGHLGLLAKFLAERQREERLSYPVAEMLDITFEPEPENVWPPRPAMEPPREP